MLIVIEIMAVCGLALEAFRLSLAAGAIQAKMSKRKMVGLGMLFAAVQIFLFILGTELMRQWGNCFMAANVREFMMSMSGILLLGLGMIYIWLGIQGRRMEERCVCPWSTETFAKYAFRHGMMFLCVGCAGSFCLRNMWDAAGIGLSLFLASTGGLAYGYWQGIKGWQAIRIVTGGIWTAAAFCIWSV